MTKKNLKDIITEKALQLEFDKIGFANPLNKVDSNNYFDEWIKSNYHGTMKWMESRKEERKNIFNYLDANRLSTDFLTTTDPGRRIYFNLGFNI